MHERNIWASFVYEANNTQSSSCAFSQPVLIYVKEEKFDVDQWELKVFESLGEKIHVQYAHNNFSSIPTNAQK